MTNVFNPSHEWATMRFDGEQADFHFHHPAHPIDWEKRGSYKIPA
jgi:hypothetical protein